MQRPPNMRTTSCGCCTNGCTCEIHADAHRGRPRTVCSYHQEHPHPRLTTCPVCLEDYCIGHTRQFCRQVSPTRPLEDA